MKTKLCRLFGHEYHIFEIIAQTEHTVTVRRLTPLFDEKSYEVVIDHPVFTTSIADLVPEQDDVMLLFCRIYLKSICARLVYLHAMQTSYHSIIDKLTGDEDNQSHR
jgi:hypothetical protein